MLGRERNDLTPDLQCRDVAVEIDPVQALNIQGDVALDDILTLSTTITGSPQRASDTFTMPLQRTGRHTSANHLPRRSEAKPHWKLVNKNWLPICAT